MEECNSMVSNNRDIGKAGVNRLPVSSSVYLATHSEFFTPTLPWFLSQKALVWLFYFTWSLLMWSKFVEAFVLLCSLQDWGWQWKSWLCSLCSVKPRRMNDFWPRHTLLHHCHNAAWLLTNQRRGRGSILHEHGLRVRASASLEINQKHSDSLRMPTLEVLCERFNISVS